MNRDMPGMARINVVDNHFIIGQILGEIGVIMPRNGAQSFIIIVFLHGDGSVPTSGVRNKQLPTCPSRVKFGGGYLILLQG